MTVDEMNKKYIKLPHLFNFLIIKRKPLINKNCYFILDLNGEVVLNNFHQKHLLNIY